MGRFQARRGGGSALDGNAALKGSLESAATWALTFDRDAPQVTRARGPGSGAKIIAEIIAIFDIIYLSPRLSFIHK